jgi:hypothetical protein
MRRFLIAIALCAILSTPIYQDLVAQEPASTPATPNFDATLSRSNAPSSVELVRTVYRFENDGRGRKDLILRTRILNEVGGRQRQLTFAYKPLSQRLEIPYIRILKSDGSIVNLVTSEVVERPRILAKPGMPDIDLDEKKVSCPQLSPGDVLEYDVATIIDKPLAPGQFWVDHNFRQTAVADEELEIDVPSSRSVKVSTKPGIKAWTTQTGEKTVYHWSHSTPIQGHKLGTVFLSHIPSPDVQLSSFDSWERIGQWYADIEKSKRFPTMSIKAKADELTHGLHTDMEKAESLYNFTAQQIKYISLESLGIAGYNSAAADEVLRRGWGDCKDKVVLLSALLEAEGMNASSALVSPNREFTPTVPSPWSFDHVITMLTLGNKQVWMDPSQPARSFGTLGEKLEGKQALVIPVDGVPHLQEIPMDARAFGPKEADILEVPHNSQQ